MAQNEDMGGMADKGSVRRYRRRMTLTSSIRWM